VGVATGTGVTKRRFEAFGALRTPPDTLPVERGFAGRPTEGETGLLYLRARHYDPATGQFLQADPLGLLSDHPYAYAAGNPIVNADPFGLLSIKALNVNLSGVDSMAAEEDAGDVTLAEESSSDGSSSSSSAGIEARAQTTGALGNAARFATGAYAVQSQGMQAAIGIAGAAVTIAESQIVRRNVYGDPVAWRSVLTRTGGFAWQSMQFFGNQFTSLQRSAIALAENLRTVARVGSILNVGFAVAEAGRDDLDVATFAANLQFVAVTSLAGGPGLVLGAGKGLADATGLSAKTRQATEPVLQDVLLPSFVARTSSFGP